METDLVSNWINYYMSQDMASRWASDQLDELVKNQPNEAFEKILEITNQTDDDFVLANLGAGPLEDLLVLHGTNFIDRVEKKAKELPKFTKVAKCVWQNSIDLNVWDRICEIQ